MTNNPSVSCHSQFPEYTTPPLEEVACGIKFTPLPNFKVPYIGLLWDRFKADFPKIEHAPPLTTGDGIPPIDEATGVPLPRIWFISQSDEQLIQFQADSFYFNWRRREGEYPRYSHIIETYQNNLNVLREFVIEHQLGTLQPQGVELTYINHLVKGKAWNSFEDVVNAFSSMKWDRSAHTFLPFPKDIAWKLRFELPNNNGLLTVNVSQGKRTTDNEQVIVLELTAKGIHSDKSLQNIRQWFDCAHEWIVRGFADLTPLTVQQQSWGRKNA